jgi:hypothetical protein
LRRYIDTSLLYTRSDQLIQVDVYTGHRTTIKRTVRDLRRVQGMTLGTISENYVDYTVRQIGNGREWHFCDSEGKRVRQEFERSNQKWDESQPGYRQRQQWRNENETSSED